MRTGASFAFRALSVATEAIRPISKKSCRLRFLPSPFGKESEKFLVHFRALRVSRRAAAEGRSA
jgi:hypothetical protein